MREQGILAVISGFSGAGKGTLIKALLDNYKNYVFSVSATTREPREGEKDGRDYFFITEERFHQMIRQDELIEYAQYVNHYYGTPKDYVTSQMAMGHDVILEIEIQGALQVKKKFPQAVLIFVLPPSARALEERLIGRGTESMDVIRARLDRACEEASSMGNYDYIVVNDEVTVCVKRLHELIQSQKCRTSNNRKFLEKMAGELKQISLEGKAGK